MREVIYLDYNATAPIRPGVIDAMAAAMQHVGNPSSVHAAGRQARKLVEEARSKVAALVGARVRDVTFCSGGTEANNAVIRGSGAASVIVSAVEHDCSLAAAKLAGESEFSLPVTSSGVVDLNALEALLEKAPQPALVSVMLANNETGVIQPIKEISELAKIAGARVHTDAVQAAGKIDINFNDLGVDYLTISSHKLGGPQGVGAIITAPTAPLAALIAGGGQELGRRSGTENVAGIVGFGEAVLEAMAELGTAEELAAKRDRFEQAVSEISNEAILIGADAPRTANTSCVAMPGVKGETQVMHFDLNGICVSSGSACSSGKVKVSHVLSAMGYTDDVAEASIRVSLGRLTTDDDIDALIKAWRNLYERAKAR
ncbi:MAG: cysteine desulfurase [Kordiimonadaceae bacterium]|nr:cysteine desulfurase [Kordiimonadaceae bacterium]MBO6570155.1 cysteine desulfurase [Kordiimonadaceae bacterium]MBO6965747.1 cysteine desulfurase [Kordiimonadaceae bacterium]